MLTMPNKKKKQAGHLVRLNPTIHAQMKAICAAEGRTMSWMSSWVLGRWIAQNHPEVISEPTLGVIPGTPPKAGLTDAEQA